MADSREVYGGQQGAEWQRAGKVGSNVHGNWNVGANLRINSEIRHRNVGNSLKNLEVSTIFSTFADEYNVMGTKEKLVERFKKKPKDFTYEETIALLAHFGYEVHNKGATSGSRVRFKNETKGVYIDIHRPHPGSIMKEWMIKAIYQHLKEYGHIK